MFFGDCEIQTYWFPRRSRSRHTKILQNDAYFVDAAAELYAEIMDDSAAMACSQRARGLIYHVTGPVFKLDMAKME